jgi:PAS domain-containing protein
VLLTAGERAYIARAKDTFVGVYEIEDLRRDEGLSLIDLWSGARYAVQERLATHTLRKWDLIAARLMQMPDGQWIVEAGLFQYMPRHREELLKEIRTRYNYFQRLFPGAATYAVFKRVAPFLAHLWLDLVAFPPPPTVITSERDPVMFTKLRFDVIEPERLYTSLLGCSELRETEPKTFTWWEQTDDGWRSLGTIRIDQERLVGETNSRERAERLRALLESIAGTAIRYRATTLQDLHQALKEFSERPGPKRESFVLPELERQLVTEYKERHYRTWPDHPLPALGGRTPRQAARLKTWRPKVINVLKDMENSEARIAEQSGPTYDFSWIWKELELEP